MTTPKKYTITWTNHYGYLSVMPMEILDRETAEKLCAELNRTNPGISHEVVPIADEDDDSNTVD